MITRNDFDRRRVACFDRWSDVVMNNMQPDTWCKRVRGRTSPDCMYSWLFADTAPDMGLGGGRSKDGIGAVGSFFSYKDFLIAEIDGEVELTKIPHAAGREKEEVLAKIRTELAHIQKSVQNFELPTQVSVQNLEERLSFLDNGPNGARYTLDRRIVLALAFALSPHTEAEEAILPFFTRDWIAYAARAEQGDSYATMFAKIYMRRREGESFYDFYVRLCREHVRKGILDSLVQNKQIVLTGAPGTGKTFYARNDLALRLVNPALVDKPESEWTPDEKAQVSRQVKFVQFHANYDYSDFVTGLKPVLVDESGNRVESNGSQGSKVSVTFEWRDGMFKKFAAAAKQAYDASPDASAAPKYVLVIDEINRADLSRVFGELFSVLEDGYRYTREKDSFVTLPDGDELRVPENLYIVGTMNDIDRSVDSIDFALRRRFAWHEIMADDSEAIVEGVLSLGGDADSRKLSMAKTRTVTAMHALNAAIRGDKPVKNARGADLFIRSLGSEYELGGAIFKNIERYGAGEFAERLWDNHVANILWEYLRGERNREEIFDGLRRIYRDVMSGERD